MAIETVFENSKKKSKIAIVGAGFSGMTLAWYLNKLGFHIEIFESNGRAGGMIESKRIDGVLVESAANAILASEKFELLCWDLGLSSISTKTQARNRFFFRDKPVRFPLKFFESVFASANLLRNFIFGRIGPKGTENLAAWSNRIIGRPFTQFVVSPALAGVYGCNAERLSAKLVIGSMFNRYCRTKKGEHFGSRSFSLGMQELTDKLNDFLERQGVFFHFNSTALYGELKGQYDAIVFAGSVHQLKKFGAEIETEDSAHLEQLQEIPLTTVAVKLTSQRTVRGFGCLFPSNTGFNSLGVLFNNDIFESRSPADSETWILNENLDVDAAKLKVIQDRMKLTQNQSELSFVKVTTWPKALPLYDDKLKDFLSSNFFFKKPSSDLPKDLPIEFSTFHFGAKVKANHNFYLTGNYLGGIGLAKILDYNERLSRRIAMENE